MSDETQTQQTEAPAEAEAPKEPKRGIGTVIREAIAAGKTNEDALAAARAEFPDARTSMASVNWYRNKMRGEGLKVPTARELKAADREKAKAEKKAAKEAEKAAKKAAKEAEKAAKKAAKQAEKAAGEQPAAEGEKAGDFLD